jgi:CBS domain-containing protein
MRVKDIMSRPVHTVRPTDTVEQAAVLLAEKQITAAPVLGPAGELVGMVSEGDLLRHRVPADPTLHLWRAAVDDHEARPRTVVDVMSVHALTAWPDEDVADVAKTMLDCDVRSIPVLDEGELVGIVSRRDILRVVVRTDDVTRHEVQHRLDEYAGRPGRWTAAVVDGKATVTGTFDDDAERTVVTVMVRTVPGVAAVDLAPLP